MRVTNNMLISGMLYNVNNNLQRMSEYQDELATGKKIQTPSDDPVGISKVLKYKTDLSELGQYETNTRDALSWINTTEIALKDIQNAIHRVRELTVQASNGTNSPEELGKIKDEIEQLKDHVISASNTSFAGRYIFSSYQTDEKLMNEDGTFNINITDDAILNKASTQYEIGIGEVIDISTNGLDLFGYVPLDNLFTKAFPNLEAVRLNGIIDLDKDYSINKAEHNGNFVLTNNYSGDNLNINMTVDGTSYTFDVLETGLNGSVTPLTEQEVIDAFSDAVDAGSGQKLSDLAQVSFDSTGDLVIQSIRHGEDTQISGGAPLFAHHSLTATIDPSVDYDTAGDDFSITIDVGGVPTVYTVDMTVFDGTIDADTALQAIKNADAGGPGPLLSSVADVYYDSTGQLVVTTNSKDNNVNISTADVTAFNAASNIGIGDQDDKWDVTLDGITYDIDETLLDGSTTTLKENDIILALKNAKAYAPNIGKLGDVADISFDISGALIIQSKATGDSTSIEGNTDIFVQEVEAVDFITETVGAQKGKMMGALDFNADYSIKKAIHKGKFDLTADHTDPPQNYDLTMVVGGTSYSLEVDESTLNGSVTPLTEEAVIKVFKDALDSVGGTVKLSDIAEVDFDEDGNLVIEAREHGGNVTITGGAPLFGHKSLQATFDPAADNTAEDIEITINVNGVDTVYDIDQSLLVAGLTEQQVIDIFGNTTAAGSGALKSVADIYFDDSTPGKLVITAKTSLPNVQISNSGTSAIFTPLNVGKGLESNNLDITVNGIKYDVDESLLDGSVSELDKEDVMALLNSAKAYQPASGVLGDVADVFFDKLGNITIQSKTFGDDVEIIGGTRIFNTSAIKSTAVNLSGDYSAAPSKLDITIGTQTFNVIETNFNGTTTPMTEDEVIEWFESASDGTNILGDVADVYFNSGGELIIDVKDPAASTEISFDTTNNGIFTGTTPTNIGREAEEVKLPVGGIITDEMVDDARDEQSFQITLNGDTKTITVDMRMYKTVSEFQVGLQDEIDSAYPPGGEVIVSLTGEVGHQALQFETTGSPQDGTTRTFDVRAITSTKSQMISDFEGLIEALEIGNTVNVDEFLTTMQGHLDNVLEIRSNIGARSNRMELVLNRIGDDNINFTRLLSDAEDVDMSEVIMKLKNAENVYQASLSTGARVIQPSLIDFLR